MQTPAQGETTFRKDSPDSEGVVTVGPNFCRDGNLQGHGGPTQILLKDMG
jgi:hypothetical protein